MWVPGRGGVREALKQLPARGAGEGDRGAGRLFDALRVLSARLIDLRDDTYMTESLVKPKREGCVPGP